VTAKATVKLGFCTATAKSRAVSKSTRKKEVLQMLKFENDDSENQLCIGSLQQALQLTATLLGNATGGTTKFALRHGPPKIAEQLPREKETKREASKADRAREPKKIKVLRRLRARVKADPRYTHHEHTKRS
jgi:hypothetical protein